MTNKYLTLLVIICLFTGVSWGQSFLKISGQVLAEDGTAIPYAHIAIKGKNMGGTTDLEGQFRYFISEDYQLDTLAISFVGYNTMEIPVQEVTLQPDRKFTLSEKVLELEGVTVYAPQKILQQALEPIKETYNPTKYYRRKGLIITTRLENEDHTLYEEIFFNLHYRGRDGQEKVGFEPLAVRRSLDYARFAFIRAKGGRRSYGGSYFFGNNTLYSLNRLLSNIDTVTLQVSDIAEVAGENAYVITRKASTGATTNYYVSTNDSKLLKVQNTFTRSQVSTFMGGSPFGSSQFNRNQYLFTGTYYFDRNADGIELSHIEHERRTQYIEKLTGHIVKNYEEKQLIKFLSFEPLDEQPRKYKDEFSIPVKLKYDPGKWTEIEATYNHKLPVDISQNLNRGTSLTRQFLQTNGSVVRPATIASTRFGKRDQKLQAEVDDVDIFIQQLSNNQYRADYAPALTWSAIPKLMAIANSTKIIDRIPRNIMSRVYVEECQLGIIALWLIDSIRKSEGRKPRKAWYISPIPVLEGPDDRKRSKERGQGNTYLAKNSDNKLQEAYESFSTWWEVAGSLSRNKAKRINPLDDSALNWLWR